MGLDKAVLNQTERYFPPYRGTPWKYDGETPVKGKPNYDLPKNLSIEMTVKNAHKTLKRVVVMDAPALLYFRSSYNMSSGSAKTIGQLVSTVIGRINYHLKMKDVVGVVFLMDKKVPDAKACKRKEKSSTIQTPYHMLDMYDTEGLSKEDKAYAAWDVYLKHGPKRENRPKTKHSYRPSFSSESNEFLLPDERTTGDSYFACLENKDLKNYLYRKICRGVAEQIKILNDKWLFVAGPGGEYYKNTEGIADPNEIPSGLRLNYEEVDSSVGYWARHFHEFNVDIESDDGDCIMALLESTHLRILETTTPVTLEEVKFFNNVRVIRNRWKSTITTVICINNLYQSIQNVFFELGVDITDKTVNPIGSYVMLARLSGGNDYIDSTMLPQLAAAGIFRTFFKYFRTFSIDFISNTIKDPANVTINLNKFTLFVVLCYRQMFPKEDLRIDNANLFFEKLEEIDPPRMKGNFPTVGKVRTLYANLCWTMSYFGSGAYNDKLYPDEFCGGSQQNCYYGYTLENDGKRNEYGHLSVRFADDTDVRHLHNLYLNRIQ